MAISLPPGARSAPHVLRNRDAIVEALRPRLPRAGTVLEVASGSGEHALHNAQAFPNLQWLPSDVDSEALISIAAWRGHSARANLLAPLRLDVAAPASWPIMRADAVLCFNMAHISPWATTEGLVSGAARLLPQDGRLFLYGPFFEDDLAPAPSNVAFDADLRRRNPQWGLRHRGAITGLAAGHGLVFDERVAMPANNLMLVYRQGLGRSPL
jgi:hypothetical protein